MKNHEEFEDLKKRMLLENEEKYGEEHYTKYGEESVQLANQKFKGLTEKQFNAAKNLEQQLLQRLKEAMDEGNSAGDVAQEVAELHKRWLSFYWTKYSKEAHVGLAKMYISDERFVQYYDEHVGKGATQFLFEAIRNYATL